MTFFLFVLYFQEIQSIDSNSYDSISLFFSQILMLLIYLEIPLEKLVHMIV